jgi:hypothetical protein
LSRLRLSSQRRASRVLALDPGAARAVTRVLLRHDAFKAHFGIGINSHRTAIQDEKLAVKPNLEFIENRMSPQDVFALVQSWQVGAFSYEPLYENLQRGEIANQDRSSDEERALMETETPRARTLLSRQ